MATQTQCPNCGKTEEIDEETFLRPIKRKVNWVGGCGFLFLMIVLYFFLYSVAFVWSVEINHPWTSGGVPYPETLVILAFPFLAIIPLYRWRSAKISQAEKRANILHEYHCNLCKSDWQWRENTQHPKVKDTSELRARRKKLEADKEKAERRRQEEADLQFLMRGKTACPHCKMADKISKLSAVYKGGVSTAQNDSPLVPYGIVQSTITTITPLAHELAPPTRPVYVGFFAQSERAGCGDILFPGVGMLFWLTWWVIIAVVVAAIVGVDSGYGKAVGLIVLGALFVRRMIGEGRKAEKARQAVPIWEKAVERWGKLYYCSRDDCVFDPYTGESLPANRMRDLLY